jgi:Na+-driven multidrug efflux pump
MFISSLYTIIDGIFVGHGVGALGLAAVAIAMPATIALFGLATMFATYKLSLIVSVVVNFIFAFICFIFERELIGLFTSDIELINISYIGLNISNLAYFITGLN